MSSSTRPSNGASPWRIVVPLLAGVFLVATHLVLEGTARFAEGHLGAYLWKEQDYLRLLSPANHVNRGAGRLFIYGPSEAREGLLPEEIGRVVRDLRPYQNAQSIGTLEDGLVVLDYIEAAYGPTAIPDAILLGITTRFIGDIRSQPSPLFKGINRYSQHFKVDEGSHPPRLVQRSAIESWIARLSLLRLQPDRYRRGVFAVASRLAVGAVPALGAYQKSWEPIMPAKYLEGKLSRESEIKKWLASPKSFWAAVHDWEPERDRARVMREVGLLLNYTRRHGIKLYVVNMPELSWNRDLYKPGRYEAYLDMVHSAFGNTPFLDLRTFLSDDEFFDDAHPVWHAGIRLSRRVGDFIAEHRRDDLNAKRLR
jgi:hypothetical protein